MSILRRYLWIVVFMVVGTLGLNAPRGATAGTRCPLPDQELIAAFDQVEQHIATLPNSVLCKGVRNGLVKKLENAEKAYKRGQPCTATNILDAYLNETQALRQGKGSNIAEELYSEGRLLLGNLLASLPDGVKCKGHKRYGMEPVVTIKESDNHHLTGTITFGEPTMVSREAGGELFTQVMVPGAQSFIGQPGMPGVPVVHKLIAFPRGAEVTVTVTPPRIAERLKLNLFPFQDQAADQEPPEDAFLDPPFVKNAAAYASNMQLPERVCTVIPVAQYRDLPIAQLSCAAGRYNPVTDDFALFDSIQFSVTFSGGSGAFVTDAALSPFEPESDSYTGELLNGQDVLQYVDHAIPEPQCLGEELLIFTPQTLRQAADRLAKWKQDKGISTNVFEVGSLTTAAEIDAFIEDRYDHCLVRPSYVLLFGDAEFVPTFYVSTKLSSETATDYPYAVYPQLFFLGVPFDFWPDFAVGRIPVDTLQQANDVVDKIIDYEQNPPNNTAFYQNITFASQFQCCRWDGMHSSAGTIWKGWDQRAYIETCELVRDHLMSQGYTVQRIYTQTADKTYLLTSNPDTTPRSYYNGTPLPADLGPNSGFAWNGSTQNIIDAFNNGRFLIMHRDHGSWNRWSHPEFSKDNVTNDLTNGNLLPVVFSANCSTGLFDNETNPGEYRPANVSDPYPSPAPPLYGIGPQALTETYFVERLIRKADGGAIGILGATRDSPHFANDVLVRGLFDAVWPGIAPAFGSAASKHRLGDILDHGKVYLISQIGVPQTTEDISMLEGLDDLFLWHVIGDPTLEMWTSKPFILSAKYELDTLENKLVVKYDIEGATITAQQDTDGGHAPIGRAKVKNGEATLEYVEPPNPGQPILLSASMENAVGRLLTPQESYPVELYNESAFGPDATRIIFDPEDGLELWEPVSNQYQERGVLFVNDERTTPLIFNGELRGGTTFSEPFSLFNSPDVEAGGSSGIPLTMLFTAPVRRVGMYIGNGGGEVLINATLTAYNEEGEPIFSVSCDDVGNDVLTFIGMDVGAARITRVELDYGTVARSEEIDDLLFE